MKRHFQTLGLILALVAVYFGAAKFGLLLALDNPSATAVWPPTGIALVAVLFFGLRASPGIFLGALLANLDTTGQTSFWSCVGIAIGNTFEAVAGAWLVNRFAGGRHAFARTQTIFRFIALAAIFSTTLSATIGVASLRVGGLVTAGSFPSVWLTWWIGDLVSNIIIAPLLLIWCAKPRFHWSAPPVAEFLALMASVLIVGQVVFGGWILSRESYAIEYLTIPPVLWAAWRFGLRGASGAALVLSVVAILGTLHGTGPFAVNNRNQSLVLLQVFTATITVTAIVLASVVTERERMETELREAQKQLQSHAQKLELTVEERTAELRAALSDLEAFCTVFPTTCGRPSASCASTPRR